MLENFYFFDSTSSQLGHDLKNFTFRDDVISIRDYLSHDMQACPMQAAPKA